MVTAEQPVHLVRGERVSLGPYESGLVALYHRWSAPLEAADANGLVKPLTLEGQRERSAGREARPEIADFTVYDNSDGAPIGMTALINIDHRIGIADFGILLGERRDRGLGTEAARLTVDWAFNVLGVHNVMLGVAAWNHRAIHVYTKLGFREIGRRTGACVTMGRRFDGVYMELLAEDFNARGQSVLADRIPIGDAPVAGP